MATKPMHKSYLEALKSRPPPKKNWADYSEEEDEAMEVLETRSELRSEARSEAPEAPEAPIMKDAATETVGFDEAPTRRKRKKKRKRKGGLVTLPASFTLPFSLDEIQTPTVVIDVNQTFMRVVPPKSKRNIEEALPILQRLDHNYFALSTMFLKILGAVQKNIDYIGARQHSNLCEQSREIRQHWQRHMLHFQLAKDAFHRMSVILQFFWVTLQDGMYVNTFVFQDVLAPLHDRFVLTMRQFLEQEEALLEKNDVLAVCHDTLLWIPRMLQLLYQDLVMWNEAFPPHNVRHALGIHLHRCQTCLATKRACARKELCAFTVVQDWAKKHVGEERTSEEVAQLFCLIEKNNPLELDN